MKRGVLKTEVMKYVMWIHIVGLLVLASCIRWMRDEIVEFIPGTYCRYSHHEFGIEYDTVVISVRNKAAKEYKILRRWKYERVQDGSPIEPEYKVTLTSGIYNERRRLLEETPTGSLYSFDAKEGLLFNGDAKYRKL